VVAPLGLEHTLEHFLAHGKGAGSKQVLLGGILGAQPEGVAQVVLDRGGQRRGVPGNRRRRGYRHSGLFVE
jgi:hypothetical protein